MRTLALIISKQTELSYDFFNHYVYNNIFLNLTNAYSHRQSLPIFLFNSFQLILIFAVTVARILKLRFVIFFCFNHCSIVDYY